MVAGLAHCLSINLMIMNTSTKSVPFSFVAADVWGGPVSEESPLLLVYDGSHYETVFAASTEDEHFCADLFREWKTKDFKISRQDILKAKLTAETDRGSFVAHKKCPDASDTEEGKYNTRVSGFRIIL